MATCLHEASVSLLHRCKHMLSQLWCLSAHALPCYAMHAIFCPANASCAVLHRYALHSEKTIGLVPFAMRRTTRLTIATLHGGDEEGMYMVYNVGDYLHVAPFDATDKVRRQRCHSSGSNSNKCKQTACSSEPKGNCVGLQ